MRLTAALAIVAFLAAGPATAQPPALSYTNPSAIAAAQPSDLVLIGGNLAGPTAIWTNLPGAKLELTPGIEGNGTKADNVSYRFMIPAETPVGIYGLRLATGKGVSNLWLFMVDDLPSLPENGSNKATPTAQPLTLPVAVDGTAEAESYDYYKLSVAAGQRVTVEVVARRLGSPLDSVIRLLDAGGRELAYSDDEGGIGADSRFVFQFATAGEYILEVRDIRYQGSANHRYRLRIGDFPLVDTPYPLGAPKGATPKLVLAGPEASAMPPINVAVPAEVPGDRLTVAARFPQGQGSATATLIVSAAAEQVELEPNDTPETASPVTLPGAVNGRFEAPKDRDVYQFQAKKGERFVFAGRTRSLGSPSDLFLRLLKADGAVLAEAEDAGTDEGAINFTFPEDGVYRLVVEDLLRRGGPEYTYRIEVEPYAAGFSLAVDAEKYDAPKGGVFVAKVTSARRDYNGPITLSLAGTAAGCSLANNVIPEGKNETVMSVTLPPALESGQLHVVHVVGTAKIGDKDFTARASSLAPLRTGLAGLPYPPAVLDGAIGLGVGPVFPDFFQLTVDPAAVSFAQAAGAGAVVVKATKQNGFDDTIALAVEGLPAGVTASVVPIEKGKPEATIQLAGSAALAEGDYGFRVVGRAAFQNQPRQVVANGVLRVVKPIELSLAPAGPLNRGAAQKLKLSVVRHPAATGAVTIKLKHLPVGVTAPAEITIPEGQNEVTIDLVAAADARVGAADLVATATTKVKDRDVAVESLPVALQVAMP